jgi:hypothetical protein
VQARVYAVVRLVERVRDVVVQRAAGGDLIVIGELVVVRQLRVGEVLSNAPEICCPANERPGSASERARTVIDRRIDIGFSPELA